MAKFNPKYLTSFTVGGGVGQRALRSYPGIDPESLTIPETDEQYAEAEVEFDQVHGEQKVQDPEDDQSFLDSVAETGLDVALGIPRGVVGAGMGIYQLADWMALDLMPNWETNPLGRSKTAVGGLVEGLSNFAVGFVPIVGWFGRAGQLGAKARAGLHVVKGAKHLQRMTGKGARVLSRIPVGGPVVKGIFGQKHISRAAEYSLRTQGHTTRANLSKYGRWLAAGMATDFTVFRAHEDRFSNWLQQFPGMQQPVFEYLATDKDDGELEGRMKNALEGILFDVGIAGVGGLIKGTIWGVKAMKRGRAAKAAGKTPDEVQEAMDATPGRPEDSHPSRDNLNEQLDQAENGTQEITVYHGGDMATPSRQSNDLLFGSSDKDQAAAYARESGGASRTSSPIRSMKIDSSTLASEDAARKTIDDLGLSPENKEWSAGESSLYELLDPALEQFIGHENVRKLIEAMKKQGFSGIKFLDQDIRPTGTGRQTAENIVLFPGFKEAGDSSRVVTARVPKSMEERQKGAENKFELDPKDPARLDASHKLAEKNRGITKTRITGKGPEVTARRTARKTQVSQQLEETHRYLNDTIDALEADGAPGMQTLRADAAKIEGTPMQRLNKLTTLIENKLIPLQEGKVKYEPVPMARRADPDDARTKTNRDDREQQLVGMQKGQTTNSYRTTLMNLIDNIKKDPGKRVDVPDYKSKEWQEMNISQQTRELRKRILDAEFGHKAHGAATVTLTPKQSRMMGNIVSGVMKNIHLYDETGALNVHELRNFLDTLHKEERAYLKGLVGLPGGETSRSGTGKFSGGTAGVHQKRILATGLELMNDPNFRPDIKEQRKLEKGDWEDYVERIWGDNDIDIGDVEQVQKALGVGEDLASAATKTAKLTNVMKILQQGYYSEVGKMAEAYQAAIKSGDTKSSNSIGQELIASFFNLNIMTEQWKRAGAMTGHALEARKTIDIDEYLRNRGMMGKGMEEIVTQLDMLVRSGDVPDEIIQQYKRSMSLRGKLLQAGIEVWTNALISGPKTIFGVTTVGNVFGMMYFPLERMTGHGLAGAFHSLKGEADLAARNFDDMKVTAKMMTSLVLQSKYQVRAFSRGLATNTSRVLPGSTMMDTATQGPRGDRQALSAEAFWSPEAGIRNRLGNWKQTTGGNWEFETTQTGAMLDWVGGFLNLPGRTMRAMDEVYKTAVVRSHVESELAAQSLQFMVHGRQGSGLRGILGEGRETKTQKGLRRDYEKTQTQDLQLRKELEEGGRRKYSDELVLFEEITAEVNGKMYKMIDENGTLYTKTRVHEDVLRKLINDGELRVGSDEFKQKLNQLVDEEWNPQLGAIGAEAEKMALKSTWQETLNRGGFTHGLQEFAKQHPFMRLIFPFIKTPRNLIKFVGDRTPGNPYLYLDYRNAKKAAKEALAAGADQAYRKHSRVAAEALGRISMGSAMTVSAAYLAYSGMITGGGPKNFAARKSLQAAGWQPYSFRVGENYVSYARLEPISTFLGLMADAVEISNHTYTHDYGDTPFENISAAILGSLSNNITNKTYLTGLSNWLNAMNEGERYGGRVLASYLTSFVPFSSLMYQSRGTYQRVVHDEDLHFRRARSLVDAFREKTGWNNSKVPLSYDITGKPISRPQGHWPDLGPITFDSFNPFTHTRKSNDPVYQAFTELKLNDGPPKAMIRGHINTRDEYRQGSDLSFYDAWQEDTGHVKLGGRTLHETLDRLVRSKEWKRLDKAPVEGVDSPARNIIRSIIQKYRRAAFNRTMQQYQVTQNKYQNALKIQQQLRRGA